MKWLHIQWIIEWFIWSVLNTFMHIKIASQGGGGMTVWWYSVWKHSFIQLPCHRTSVYTVHDPMHDLNSCILLNLQPIQWTLSIPVTLGTGQNGWISEVAAFQGRAIWPQQKAAVSLKSPPLCDVHPLCKINLLSYILCTLTKRNNWSIIIIKTFTGQWKYWSAKRLELN